MKEQTPVKWTLYAGPNLDFSYSSGGYIIGDGKNLIETKQISKERVDVVMIRGHGSVQYINKPYETAGIALMGSGITQTIDAILEIKKHQTPQHWEIMGCHQGALYHDIKRNADKFKPGTTFLIHASSKHSSMMKDNSAHIQDRIKQYSDGLSDPIALFAEDILKKPETKYFIQIVEDTTTGKKKR